MFYQIFPTWVKTSPNGTSHNSSYETEVNRFTSLFGRSSLVEYEDGTIFSRALYLDNAGNLRMLGVNNHIDSGLIELIFGPDYVDVPTEWNLDSELYSLSTFLVRSTVVPVPAAVWLFGSGLIGLIGVARRKKS